MAYTPCYPNKRNWANLPSESSPINETNLNAMDNAIYTNDGRIVELSGRLDTDETALGNKVDKQSGKGLSEIKSITISPSVNTGTKIAEISYKNQDNLTIGYEIKNGVVVDSALSSSSENPVQNKVINTALGNKVDKVTGKGLSTNDYTTAEKNKLAGISAGAKNVSISDTLNDGDTIANITIDGTTTAIKAKQPNESEMNVRSAMLLLSSTPIGENAPFVKRRSGGNVPFPALLKDKIIGASVVWNQLVKNGNFASTTGWGANSGSISASSNKCTFTISSVSQANGIYRDLSEKIINNHKYFLSFTVTTNKATKIGYRLGTTVYNEMVSVSANTRTTISRVVNGDSSNTDNVVLYCNRGSELAVNDTCIYENVNVTDLTAMFGSTIADYVNTLETQTAGSGIAWLKSYGFFTEPYYAHSANTIQSVSVSAKVNKDSEDTTISTVALDHTTLRGLFKLDANNKLYADGDIYPSSGSGSVKYNEVDLGSLVWTYDSANTRFISSSISSLIKKATSGANSADGLLCEPFIANSAPITGASADKVIAKYTNGYLYVIDSSYTDAPTFKTAMNGKKLVYELATLTTQTLTHYPNLQNIASGGTEEFIDYGVSQGTRDVSIPVGGERQYYQGMDLPALPTASGNHNLQFNPSSGFSWS